MWDPFFSPVEFPPERKSVDPFAVEDESQGLRPSPDNLGPPGEWLVDALLFHNF
jgi:hypothetical protein